MSSGTGNNVMARYAREAALLVSIAVLAVIPAFSNPGFYRASVFQGIVLDNLSVLIAAIGMTVVIVTAEIDISIAAQLAVCGVAAGSLSRAGLPIVAVVPAAIACGALLGLVNGILVARLMVPSIVATLATWVILENGLLWITRGEWVQNIRSDFQWFGLTPGQGQIAFCILALAVFAVAAFVLARTRFGRRFYAVGCDHDAALRMRIHPDRVVLLAFVILGALMGLAAVVHYCRFPSIETGAGHGLELKVIASVVVGGTAISGGRGRLFGTLLGVGLLAMVGSVLAFTPLGATAERAVQGTIILLAVVADKVMGGKAAA